MANQRGLATLVLAWAMIGGPASAAPATVDIPPQALADSLTQFAAAAGVTLFVDAALVKDKSAPGIKGTYEPEEAFAALLAGSGLRVQRTAQDTFMIVADAPAEQTRLQPITVEGEPDAVSIGPMPGLELAPERIPGNVQRISAQEIKDSHALSLADLMNTHLQSVNINDYQGNPYQMDVVYRGFTAGPQLGTPQGLSVFFDGIRVNEPFGDVVNWDMIPMNALSGVDVFPGSNPMFGLGTLGGALSLRTKSGFDRDAASASLTGGSFGRIQAQAEAGGQYGPFAAFIAGTFFDENGWRDNSPSTVKQLFGKAEWQGDRLQLGLSTLYAQNKLIGNGLIPHELFDEEADGVFTSPDRTRNSLLQFQLAGAFQLADSVNVTAQWYRRKSDRDSLNGDFYRAFEEMGNDFDYGRETSTPANDLPLCQWVDADQDGRIDPPFIALNAPCNATTRQGILEPLTLRNGASGGGAQDGTGVVNGTPIGQIDRTNIDQLVKGGAAQFNFNLEKHRFMIGGSLDSAYADYGSTSQLALIDETHEVYLDPANIDPLYYSAYNPITNNAFDGTSSTLSIYFSETWIPVDQFSMTASLRYNRAHVTNDLKSRTTAGFSELHNVREFPPDMILCPAADPASCPSGPNASQVTGYETHFEGRDLQFELGGHEESFDYNSFNPSIGATWSPSDSFNMSAYWSRGTRTPSVIELGCAFDTEQPFAGGACTLPSTLSGDPFLPQIKARTREASMRGLLDNGWQWNTSFYRTDLEDDIYFVGFTPSRSYFDTIGDTKRKGMEFGLSGSVGKLDFSANLSLINATFETPFWLSNLGNSSTDRDINGGNAPGLYPFVFDCCGGGEVVMPVNEDYITNHGLPTYRLFKVEPGSRMPGVPARSLNFSLNYRATERWNVRLDMVAHSSAYARGNENNEHEAGPSLPEDGQLLCDEPVFDEFGNFTGYFNCVAQPAFFRQTQPYLQKGETPAYAVFDLESTYRFDAGFTVSLLISNLFDKKYYSASRLGQNPFAPSIFGAVGPSGFNYNSKDWQNTNFVAPGAPRAVWLTVAYEFDAGNRPSQ